MTPRSAGTVLDACYLEVRAKLLDLAAALDRIDRGSGSLTADDRLESVQAALQVLLNAKERRAESVQQIFSLDYDPGWVRPVSRG